MTVLQDKLASIKLYDTSVSSRVKDWMTEATTRIERYQNVTVAQANRITALEGRVTALETRVKALEDKALPPPVPLPPPDPIPAGQTKVQLSGPYPSRITAKSNTYYVGPATLVGVDFMNGVDNITLENVTITNGATDDGIRMMNCSNVTLRSVEIHDVTGGMFCDGGAFVKADDVTLYSCSIHDIYSPTNGDVGIGIQSCGKRWKVYDTVIQKAAQQGALLDASTGKGATDFYFERCKFLDNGWGTYAGGNHGCYAKAPNCVFVDCEASGNDKNGFSLRWAGAKVLRCYTKPRAHPQPIDVAWFGYASAPAGTVTIEDNSLDGSTAAGIYINGDGSYGVFNVNRNVIRGKGVGINAEVPINESGNTFTKTA